MYSYKLTGRGKVVLTMLVMMVSLICSFLYINGNAIASDNTGVILQDTVHLSDELENLKDDFVAKEVLITNEINDEIEKEILSINVEDIKTYEKKLAFLTFDDGPSHNVTPLILKILEQYDVHATFFVLGLMAEKNGYLLNELRDKGHSIGIHSYSHELNKLLKDKDSFLNEIKMTEDVIKENLGENFTTRLFRFPGGSFETYKQLYLNDLHDTGYVSVDWNALTGDSEYKNPKREILLERFKATTINKDSLIILMHDSESKEVSAEILPDIIEHLKFEGYEFAVLK